MLEECFDGPVLSRRSVQSFLSKSVEEIELLRLLKAAMCAPSVDDERPWHFLVIREKPVRMKLAEISPYTHVVNDAPVAIVVCGDESLQIQQGCWVLDCSAATENILIEAQLIGLGALWLGVYPVEGRIQKVRSILSTPGHIIPFSIIAVGYPAEYKAPVSRFDERRVHWDQWMVKKIAAQKV